MAQPTEQPSPFRAGALLLSATVPTAALGGSRTLHNARFLLEAASREPIAVTKTLGNMNRRFVTFALEGMAWPKGYAEKVRSMNKTPDEHDVPKLGILRVALVNGGLLRRYRGAFATTKRGKHLAQPGQEGALFLALWVALFRETNLAYTDALPEDDVLQWCVPQVMARALEGGRRWVTMDELRHSIAVSGGVWDAEERFLGKREAIDLAVQLRLLTPLEDFGLIGIEYVDHGGFRDVQAIRATPLLRAFAVVSPPAHWHAGGAAN